MDVLLETERLILRRLTVDDVDNLWELDSDPAVMRYLNGGTPTPREVIARELLPGFLRDYARGDGYGFWAVVEKDSGRFLGWISLRPSEDGAPGDATLGYRLRRAAWGRGYATEAARALIDTGFADLGARRILATTYQDNLGSRRVMEKVGMTHRRSFRLTPEDLAAQDTFHSEAQEVWDGDDVEYSITRAEWAARRR